MQLKQEITKMKAAAKAIIDKAKNEGRDLTADEQKDFDDCCTKAEALQQILDNAESNTKRLDGILACSTPPACRRGTGSRPTTRRATSWSPSASP